MRDRCNRQSNPKWFRYGGRGIRIDPRWNSYERFLSDMGRRPSKRHSVHRVDNDGDYSPENCVWALPKEQSRNTARSRKLTALGKTQTIAEWAEETGINYGTIWSRVSQYGWDAERAVAQ
jgi:hypothetical protein